MKDDNIQDLSWDEWDELQRPAPEVTDFDRVVDEAISRRGFLGGLLAFGSGAAVMGTGLLKSSTALADAHGAFGFTPIPAFTDNTIHVPEGYEWKVVARWGDALFSDAPSYEDGHGVDGSDRIFGENTDGMDLFVLEDGREVIAINHEYVNPGINIAADAEGRDAYTPEEIQTLMNLQGVTVMEIADSGNGYEVVVDSPYNRRIHHNTPMMISGPAAGHDMLKTSADPTGTVVLGTMNNCGSGRTLWGTYMTCEENFNGYFGTTAEMEDQKPIELPDDFSRYGIGVNSRYQYETLQDRYDIVKEPNEPYRFGYVVEIDPADPEAMPVKRTALGRFKHENAAMAQAEDGRIVVYMGDDERGEFMYKYVSNGTWAPGEPTDGLLDDGTLYAAVFNTDGTGQWVALTPESTGMDAAMICILTRQAASAVGATTMDRPEWIAVSSTLPEAYCCLTNNSRRAPGFTNAGGDPAEPIAGSPNPREENRYGQIVRWRPDGADHGADTFAWDLYVMAGNPVVGLGPYAGSENVNEGNMFNSPDGMVVDSKGLIWIQTDGDDSNEGPYAGMGNNQMLVGHPETGEIARFLTGPSGCEVTGLTFNTDYTVAFAGIQHPGGTWPDGAGKPRSSVVAIWRTDGAPVG
ncbi:PhoX family phosphatase [Ponticoccus sp. SC2-23]|uniref:PhoX family protein n=1 Tax=Alexandriicola marinus TaxID=2081710 RepID=UPI000FDB9118|nr:PhoX family phosphatase [Alexandriicola marinus]MBM1222541.1 PhoX family phosphatase [Ponticoccus sp. SC6-9]MBM1227046.1 PhoX family phosphatase [Ponticoccus sp. SC6-15]MBM1231467.1 PhoX family phosphatase [Ponticoccus sp. SC6-38]MBM1236097.1 PhoX family phosphatase [Ponticoccus sp. SC6-45]MBM1240490.1 PhoX family phosphatase [Ponticoccus sp. SC6-49]MBM1245025.1 PhoX family phosphatase [Ponticoccus sp. SC2-64]MBM1249571.1 PhoX family phosphatase [Ponticoccus sp. SC6-42]MBM1253983.1 PhoX 